MSAAADVRQKSAFAPIRVAAGAFEDPRIRIAAGLLRIPFEKLFFRLQRLWSWVTAQQRLALHPEVLIEFLGRRKDADELTSALCHDAVQLAELDAGGLLSLRLQDLFGSTDWYAEYLATAPAGGQARAACATRHEDGTFARRDIESEVLAALADGAELRRCDLRQRLRCQKKAVCDAVKALLAASAIEETKGGYLRLSAATMGSGMGSASSSAAGSAGSLVPVEPVPRPADGSRGTHGATAEPSAPAPAPAPAPAGESAPAPAGVCAIPAEPLRMERAGPIAVPAAMPGQPHAAPAAVVADGHTRPPAAVLRHPSSGHSEALERVAARYDELGQELEPDWRIQSTAHRTAQIAEVWPSQQAVPEAAVLHALDMLAVEARERRRLGLADPTRWFRAAWSEGVFKRALDLPNANAARQVAREERAKQHPRAHPGSASFSSALDRRRAASESQ